MKTIHILISGRVQGVGFRYFTLNRAIKYHIKGTIENLYINRDVELYCQGKKDDLELFLVEIRKGPGFARINYIRENVIDLDPFEDFRII
jgi:acylphosphatase